MARKPVAETRQQYSVKLRPSTVAELDKLADKLKLTRSQLMGNLIETALEDAKLLNKGGIFTAVVIADEVMRKFKEYLFNGKISLTKEGELEIRK
jgi:hypothetical protein